MKCAVFFTAALLTAAPLEQFLAINFPQDLVAAPGGGKVAWVMNERGPRNVWVAEAPAWKGRRLTAYTADDGQEIGELAFTQDGKHVLFTRGGDLETRRDIPNPTSSSRPVEQAIYAVALAGGPPRKLADGNRPVPSPKGDRVVFLRSGAPWSVPFDGSSKPEQLIWAKGRLASFVFSPSGERLAFVNNRGTHGFIGVYDFAAQSLRYLDPSVDSDREPVWSPDSRRLAFVRIPPNSRTLGFAANREAAEPWSIRVADVATGKGREIFRADKGPGSAFSSVVGDALLWTAGDQIVFPWEKTGWRHLYKVSAAGGRPVPLTQGACEIEHVALAQDAASVLVSHNCKDIDRRQVARVGVAEARVVWEPAAGAANFWAPVDGGNGALVALRSDARTPARPALFESGQVRDVAPELTASYPAGELVEPQAVIFPSTDGLPIHGQLFLPKGGGGKRPAIVFFHGGSRRQMLLGFHYLYYYSNTYAMNQYWASQGYVVLSVNYRSGTGYGLDFREALDYGAAGASEVQDVMAAALYLRTRPDVDERRIAAWGGSYGGYLTAMALAKGSNLYAAGVDIHGVHDWNVVRRNFAPDYDPQRRADAARLAFESSPMAWIRTWKSPVLLIHGDDDRNVPFSESVTLAEALRRQGVEFEQLVFPDEVHDFLTHGHWLEAMRAADDFLGRKLRHK
jgi:dipeptidyl aminopeptidase/acylaminoacyl peptidase